MPEGTRYIVRWLLWYQAPHGDRYTRRLPVAEPVRRFETFDEAEYFRRELERVARDGENPFRFGGEAIFFQSSLDLPRLHDWFLDAGIDPPVNQLRHRDWREWWDAFSHTWSPEQIHHAWQGLNKIQFHDVIEEPDGRPLQLVSEIGFLDTGYHNRAAEREGGRPVALFRRPVDAIQTCDRLNRARREETFDWWRYRYLQRLGYGEDDQLRGGREAVYFEVVEVPGEVPPEECIGYVLQRRAFDADGLVCRDGHDRDTGSRVPLRVFASRAEAVAAREELTSEIRAMMNPFQVFTPQMSGIGERSFYDAVESLSPPLPWPTESLQHLWREWWDLCQEEMSDTQRGEMWELFADQPLFEVLPMELRAT